MCSLSRCRWLSRLPDLHAVGESALWLMTAWDGHAMKAQKTATKMHMYFQQKRKCRINKTATCNSKSATSSVSVIHRIQTRSKQFLCWAYITTQQFTISRDVTWSSADVTTMDCSAVRIILDGRCDMSFTAVYVSCKRIQLWKLLRYEFLQTRNAPAATLLTLSESSRSPYSATAITSFVSIRALQVFTVYRKHTFRFFLR